VPEMSTTSAILQEALVLPSRDRAELALRLMESLDDGESSDVEAAWAAEVKGRVEALRRGEVEARPAAEVFRDARARLTARR